MNDDAEFRKRTRYAITYTLSVLLVAWLLWRGREVVLLLFAALLLAMALQLAVEQLRRITRLSVSRPVGLMMVLAGGVLFVTVVVTLRGAAILSQIDDLRQSLPLAAHKLIYAVQGTEWGRWLIDDLTNTTYRSQRLFYALGTLSGWALSSVSAVAGLVIMTIIGIYVAADPNAYIRVCLLLVRPAHRRSLRTAFSGAIHQLQWWLLARVVSMTIVGVLVAVGLAVLRVPLWGTLGTLAAILTFIPNVGPILSCVPAALMAFADEPYKGLWTLLLFAGVHFVEGNFVTPMAESRLVRIPPGVTLVLQLFMGVTTGALGVALAAPLAAALSGLHSSLRPRRHRVDRQIPEVAHSASAKVFPAMPQ